MRTFAPSQNPIGSRRRSQPVPRARRHKCPRATALAIPSRSCHANFGEMFGMTDNPFRSTAPGETSAPSRRIVFKSCSAVPLHSIAPPMESSLHILKLFESSAQYLGGRRVEVSFCHRVRPTGLAGSPPLTNHYSPITEILSATVAHSRFCLSYRTQRRKQFSNRNKTACSYNYAFPLHTQNPLQFSPARHCRNLIHQLKSSSQYV